MTLQKEALNSLQAARGPLFAVLDAAQGEKVWKFLGKSFGPRNSLYEGPKAKELAETAADNMAVLTLLRSRSEARIFQLLTPEQRKQASERRDPPEFGPASLRMPSSVPHMQRAM